MVTTRVSGFGFSLLRSSLGSRWVGMSALKRLGFNGVTTMKMISSTSKTSINGVTLMNGWAVVLLLFSISLSPIDIWKILLVNKAVYAAGLTAAPPFFLSATRPIL